MGAFESEFFLICLSSNMFYLIGLGLCDEKDITVRGLEVPNSFFPNTPPTLNLLHVGSEGMHTRVP